MSNSEKKKQDFMLKPIKTRRITRCNCPGMNISPPCPGCTPEDARMKSLVRKNCTGCHSASYPLQHRFDAAGWNTVLELMKHVNVLGTYRSAAEHKPNPNIVVHQKELLPISPARAGRVKAR